jgi:hypothetical protein
MVEIRKSLKSPSVNSGICGMAASPENPDFVAKRQSAISSATLAMKARTPGQTETGALYKNQDAFQK